MFLLNEIFFPHTFYCIIFLVFFILAKHNLTKSPSTKHLQQFKLFESVYVIFVSLTFENDLALCLDLITLLNAFSIEHQRLDCMKFLVIFTDILDCSCIALE